MEIKAQGPAGGLEEAISCSDPRNCYQQRSFIQRQKCHAETERRAAATENRKIKYLAKEKQPITEPLP